MKYIWTVLLLMAFTCEGYTQIELVKDINPSGTGIGGSQLVVYKNELYFSGQNEFGNKELWKSDGTEAGTVLVKDLRASGSSSPENLIVAGNFLYFTALTDLTNRELFRTDGTAEGTVLVADLRAGPASSNIKNLLAVGSKLFFTGSDGNTGTELYVLQGMGTPERLSDFKPGSSNSIFLDLVAFQDQLIFSTESDADSVGFELYVSDGTLAGTKLFKDLYPGADKDGSPENFSVIGDKLFFAATDEAGEEPWISDGTPGGTTRIKDIFPGVEDSHPRSFTGNSANKVFFTATDENAGGELFITDGTANGTKLLKDIRTESNWTSSPDDFTAADDKLFFTATETYTGRELWYSDGTTEGSYLVEDLFEGTDGTSFQQDGLFWYDNVLYFGAEDGTTGLELRTTTIPGNEIMLVQDLASGTSDSRPADFVVMNDTLYFFADDTNGKELRKLAPISEDPCDGISCPLGQICYDGICYDPVLLVEGVVSDDSTGLPLANVEVLHIRNQDTLQTTFSDEDGYYALFLTDYSLTALIFSLKDYVTESLMVNDRSDGEPQNIALTPSSCANINCTLGYVCYDGGCYEAVHTFRGTVLDPGNNPVVGARVEDLNSDKALYTDQKGQFEVDETWTSIVVLKDGFSPRLEDISGGSNFTVILRYDPCYSSACGPGQVCRGGTCYGAEDTVFASFTIYDQDGFEIESPIEVTELGTNSKYIAIGETKFRLITQQPHLVFHDPGGTYLDDIQAFIADKEAYFLQLNDACKDVICPLGQICYQGVCYESSEIVFRGYVRGYDSLVLPNTLISANEFSSTTSDINGYFELSFYAEVDSILVRFDKPDFGTRQLYLHTDSLNMVSIIPQDHCFNVNCPPGYICVNGQCKWSENVQVNDPDACKDIWCPVGQICYEGGCYEPCLLDPELCFIDTINDPCDDILCPLGQICYGGGCYDQCLETHTAGSEFNTCYSDPCDGITVPPGYICSNGTLVPLCPENTLACQVSDLCSVIACTPGEACFQCFDESGYNTSGTSILKGTLNLSRLKSGNSVNTTSAGVYLYLLDAGTERKVAISRTDSEGNFRFENIPAADYSLFVILPGYLITAEEQRITVEDGKDLQIAINSQNEFLQLTIEELSSVAFSKDRDYAMWYPTPNSDGRFYMEEVKAIEQVKLYNARGAEIAARVIHQHGNGQAVLSINQTFGPGLYFVRWKVKDDLQIRSQVLVIY